MMLRIISILYKYILKPVLFLRKPETMHKVFWKIGFFFGKYYVIRKVTAGLFRYDHPMLTQNILNMSLRVPVWLAAWFDKDIQLCHIGGSVGFGFMEVWSITLKPYEGNPWTRLYRLKKSAGLIVNYWLKNKWIRYAASVLAKAANVDEPLRVSIAKTNCTKTCDMQSWIEDYYGSLKYLQECSRESWQYTGDAYVLNISCPNSFGGEDFASPTQLNELLTAVDRLNIKKPVFIKMPLNKERNTYAHLLDVCMQHTIQGLIIANLTKDRSVIVEASDIEDMPGGISGRPTYALSTDLLFKTYAYLQQKKRWDIVLVGVGWIFSAEDAYQKIKSWASLLQLITGMIYEWPQLIGDIHRGLVALLKRDWYTHISQAIWALHTSSTTHISSITRK